MPNIAIQLGKLSLSARIELFKIDATELGGSIVYLHNGSTNKINAPIVWQGQTYQAFPIEGSGWDKTTSGPMPRPILKVSNAFGLVGALVRDLRGLRGAKVIRKQTLAQYLDAVNFEDGNAFADPNAGWPDELWRVDRRAPSDHRVVTFELASPMDVAGLMLPRRQVLEVCIWEYRGPDCGYTGPAVAKADDTPTNDLDEDDCSHCLRGCRLRQWPDNELPISGFPGAGSIQEF